jgi:hypothetical protein
MTKLKSTLLAGAILMQWQEARAGWVPAEQVQHMGGYTAPLLQAPVSTAFKSAGALWCGATARRIQFYEAEFGQTGAYATTDAPCQWDISRFSVTGAMVGSTVVTNLLDPADIASLALFMNNVTTEPTVTTAGNGLTLKSWAINQRGSYRFRCLDDGDNILVPATTAFGLAIRTLSITSGFANSAVGNISFIER